MRLPIADLRFVTPRESRNLYCETRNAPNKPGKESECSIVEADVWLPSWDQYAVPRESDRVESTDLCDGAHELREIFAVVRGVIERVEASVHRGFGQGDAV